MLLSGLPKLRQVPGHRGVQVYQSPIGENHHRRGRGDWLRERCKVEDRIHGHRFDIRHEAPGPEGTQRELLAALPDEQDRTRYIARQDCQLYGPIGWQERVGPTAPECSFCPLHLPGSEAGYDHGGDSFRQQHENDPTLRIMLILAPLLLASPIQTPEDPGTNILFCIADDWGWPHAGIYGDGVCETPTFDRIASTGILFDAAFVSSPSCTPSRNSILTGQHFFRLGAGANLWSTLAPEHKTFMELLAAAGRHVGHSRKAWGPGSWKYSGREEPPAGQSFPSFEEFLNKIPAGEPFCFWLGAHDPHRGYKPGSVKGSGMDLDAIQLPPPYPDSEVIRSDIADYYYEVQRFDADVGAALSLLGDRGLLEETLVMMTGDHGFPFPRGKTNLYDLGSRVPLALSWEGKLAPGRRIEEVVSLVDLAPTLLEVAGVDVPKEMTGRSWLNILLGEAPPTAPVVLGRERHTVAQPDHKGGYPMRGLRTQDYLYIRNLRPDDWPAGWEAPGARPFRDVDNGPTKTWLMQNRAEHPEAFDLCFGRRPAEELYDLSADPWQVSNLAGHPKYLSIQAELDRSLQESLVRLGDPRAAGAGEIFDTSPYGPR